MIAEFESRILALIDDMVDHASDDELFASGYLRGHLTLAIAELESGDDHSAQAVHTTVSQSLEKAIVSHLKEFIMEMGMGFCLEDEQKRLLIDDRYYKVDLVFYHRILKCHCIVELKAHRLDYADVAQLNMYMEYYRKHYMQPDDNPPVGLLLCTEYGQEMVEYLAPFTDPQLFVARYELQLPSKEKIRDFLMQENVKSK